MAFKKYVVTALMLASVAYCSQRESLQDQYMPRKDTLEPKREATDTGTLQVPATSNKTTERNSSSSDNSRQKRSYYPWSNSLVQPPTYDKINVWKPPVYQLSRPYYIPIFGSPGRIPIYYPPQPFLINPGAPLDNPNKQYRPTSTNGPPYLPPRKDSSSSTMPTIGDRFNLDDDDAPVWDAVPDAPSAGGGRPLGEAVPTRVPRPQGEVSHPPLVHSVESTRSPNMLAADEDVAMAGPANGFPTAVRPLSTTPAPAQVGPGPCVWAIVSCCSASSNEVRYNCFEQRGCHGAFWGASPCESDFAKAAIASALNYYNSK